MDATKNNNEGIVDLEAELVAVLDEIENLRNINEKQERDHLEARNQLAKQVRANLVKKDAEISALQEKLKRISYLNQKFEKISTDLNNLLLQQRNVEDKSGIGYSHKTENQPAEFSTKQDVSLIKEALTKHKENLKKIHEPLNQAQR